MALLNVGDGGQSRASGGLKPLKMGMRHAEAGRAFCASWTARADDGMAIGSKVHGFLFSVRELWWILCPQVTRGFPAPAGRSQPGQDRLGARAEYWRRWKASKVTGRGILPTYGKQSWRVHS